MPNGRERMTSCASERPSAGKVSIMLDISFPALPLSEERLQSTKSLTKYRDAKQLNRKVRLSLSEQPTAETSMTAAVP